MLRFAIRAIRALLMDERGGLGDMVMELAIIGAGAYTIFNNVRTGISTLGSNIQNKFQTTTIP